jgi:outer membrane receptor protein involved in Fe transport
VSPRSIDGILSQEADCRIGHTVGGSPVDINSPTCKEVLSLVDRNLVSNGPLQSGINSIATYPINISGETVKGVTAGAQYRVDAAGAGDFVFGLDYNVTLKHTYKQYPGDPTIDTLTYLSFPREFKNRASASVTWNKGIWSTTLFGIRNGETLNYATTGKVGPWITYNASIQAQVNDQVTISLIGNNVLNKRAPIDRTYTAYPFYDGFNYDGYGRSIMAELNWKLF